MGKIGSYLALIWVVLLASCEQETLDPRTNPRFSVTIVQEISSSGVQFGADIYDYGVEEILEYGFVYTQSTGAPNLNQDDFVASQGRPGEHFELVANHSMALGKKYYVSAFLRTSSTLVFSKSIEFVSQGSEGFIVNSVEWPELIYKAQNLVVKGRRFSKHRSNYKVKIGQFDIYPNLVDSTTLLLPLPEGLLTQTTGQDIEMELRIEISEKVYSERKVLKFQEPGFEKQEIQTIDFDEEVTIKGEFLDLGTISLRIQGQIISGLRASPGELRFFPYKGTTIKPTSDEVEITYEARGIRYPLGKIFKVNGPKISDEKIVLSKDNQVIPAVNFNLEDKSDIQFLDENGEKIDIEVIRGDISGITINTEQSIYPGRQFKAQIKSLGILSNFVEFEIANPVVLIKGKQKPYKYDRTDFAIVSSGNAYILTKDAVIEESLDGNFNQRKISGIPADFSKRFNYIRMAVEGGFIIGGGSTTSYESLYDLFFFSMEKLQWEKLPDLPQPYNYFKRVTSKNGNLIFEEAQNNFNEVLGEKWVLNLGSKTWERLENDHSRFFNFQTFYVNGEAFIVGLEYSNSRRAIYKMKDDFSWISYLETPTVNDNSDFESPLVINNKYYILSERLTKLLEFDLNSMALKGYRFPHYNFKGDIPVEFSGQVYILNSRVSSTVYEDIKFDLF